MVRVEITPDKLIIHVLGMDKVWAMKSSLELPIAHISGAEVGIDPTDKEMLKHKIRVGSHVPGVVTAGSYHSEGHIVFWDVHHEDKAISVTVTHDKYTKLILEVEDPAAVVAAIRARLAK